MVIRKELQTIMDLESSARVLPVGAQLYRQGDQCSTAFVVLSGWIALSTLLDDGSCQILDFALPGTVLGILSAPNAPMYHSAGCLSLARVCAIPQQKLDAIIETNPRLGVLLCRQSATNEARAHDHLTNLGLRDSRERIAHLLLELYVRLHQRLPNAPGEIIDLPLSQGHIGQALGLTYVHVCRKLQILREQKIVRLAHHKLEIIDPQSLIATAGVPLGAPDQLGCSPDRQPSERPATDGGASGSLPAGWMPLRTVPPPRPSLVASSTVHQFIDAKAA
jgi:CRP/FNR family transcriptional regulator